MSDLHWINFHTFQTEEFKSDLYHWVMHTRCYSDPWPFNMECHRFQVWGRNVKVYTYTWYMPVWCTQHVHVGYIFRLRTAGIMELKGIHRVYEPSPVPTLYVRRVEDLLGRIPLIPCFLDGNTTSIIPHKYSSQQKDPFECCCAVVRALTCRGAAMITRSTPGFGTLDSPSLAWAASLWPKLRRS